MTIEQLMTHLNETLSGLRAKETAARLATHHRIQGSPGFLDAASTLKEDLTRLEIPSEILTFPADGRHRTFSWVAPVSWHIRDGELRLIEPETRSLVRFDEIPQGILAHSRCGEIEAEVVHIGDGTRADAYEGIEVERRFVLATGRPQQVAPLAVERGAVGIILYPTAARAEPSRDLVQYAGLWPSAEQLDTTPLGFSISRREAERLLATLERGPVRVRGFVDADLGPGSLSVLEAWIEGRSPQRREVLLVAHLCHPRPSANDNASGSALLLEVAHALSQLVTAGTIPLDRTVRFLWVPEFYGTLPWAAARRACVANLLYVLNLDMVGESPERLGEPFQVFRVPGSLPAAINAWFEPILERIADDERTIAPGGSRRPMNWRLSPASGGSDHVVFNDPEFAVPAAMFGHDDPLHHTHIDDIDMVDPTELKRVGVLTAALAALPGLLPSELDRLAGWLLRYGVASLTRTEHVAAQAGPGAREALFRMALQREEARTTDFQRLAAEAEAPWDDVAHRRALTAAHAAFVAVPGQREPERSEEADRIRPRRRFQGPLPYTALLSLPTEDQDFLKRDFSGNYGAMQYEALSLCDGRKTLAEIALGLSLEFEKWIPTAIVRRALEILERSGWVSFD